MEQQQQQQPPNSNPHQATDGPRWTAPIPFHIMIEMPASVASSITSTTTTIATTPQPDTHQVNLLEYCHPLFRGAVFRLPEKYKQDGVKVLLKDLQDAALKGHPEARLSCSHSKVSTLKRDDGSSYVHRSWNLRCIHYHRVSSWQRKNNKVKAESVTSSTTTTTNSSANPLQSHTTNNKRAKNGKRRAGCHERPFNPFGIREDSKKCPFSLLICLDDDGFFYTRGGLGCAHHQYHVHPDPNLVKPKTEAPTTKKTTTKPKATSKRKQKGQSQEEVKSSTANRQCDDEYNDDNDDDYDDPPGGTMYGDEDSDDDDEDEHSVAAAALALDHGLQQVANPYQHLPPMVRQFQEAFMPLVNQLFSTIDHPGLTMAERQRFTNRAMAANMQLLYDYRELVSDVQTVASVREYQASNFIGIYPMSSSTTNSNINSNNISKRRRHTKN